MVVGNSEGDREPSPEMSSRSSYVKDIQSLKLIFHALKKYTVLKISEMHFIEQLVFVYSINEL